ncbi:hypothetical protein P7K49_002442 [Saguinus oedipus]|uniref:Uncharacterized protein n=1 Tax=Saguinus oedipus TaxID=9490 RepID=A0ABQ9WIC1_SAGOE|nr:hypothetical protein P7K49_002442 [Saguinus oedipus]
MQRAPVPASATQECVPESFYTEGALTFTWKLWHRTPNTTSTRSPSRPVAPWTVTPCPLSKAT